MNTLELINERYSVRKFKDTPIEAEKMEKILEAIQHAPTAHNNQPVKVYVCKSEEALAKVDAVTRCRYKAPTVLVVCYDDNEIWRNPFEEDFHAGEVDATIVSDHAILEAWEQGIGSCWVMWFNRAELVKQLGLPENIKPVILIPMGYADDEAKPSPQHSSYKDLKDIVYEV